jgi:hypothetical protein
MPAPLRRGVDYGFLPGTNNLKEQFWLREVVNYIVLPRVGQGFEK